MKRHHWYILGLSSTTVLLGFLAYRYRNKIKNKIDEVFDYRTEKQLLSLDPQFRKKIRIFLSKARKEGIDLRLVEGHRSCERQNKLYAQGRTAPGQIVTKAKCGQSPHNYKKAGDVYEFKNGKVLFENPNWDRIGELAVESGLEWGGNWKSFKDRPHVQDLGGQSVSSLYREFKKTGKLIA